MIGVSLLFIIFGVLIKYYKAYWLIAGYNTASPKYKAKVDIVGLGRFMGDSCFIMGGICLIVAGLMYFDYTVASYWAFGLIPIYSIYMLIKGQVFDPNTRTPDGRMSPDIKYFLGVILVIMLSVGGSLGYGSIAPEVTITSEYIQIGGIYGIKLRTEEIREVSLQDSLPKILRKTNGFDLGNILKGNFALEDLGHVKLYVYRSRPPYIYITREHDYIIINYKDARKTEELYNSIVSKIK